MALIKCPDCGKLFSEYAECCPECGCPVEEAKAANKETSSMPLQDESGNVVDQTTSTPLLNEKCEIEEQIESPNDSPIEESVSDEVTELDNIIDGINNHSKYGAYILFAVLAIAFLIMVFINVIHFKSPKRTDANTEMSTDTINSKEQTKEEQILERANYIFKNIPDHSEISDVDKSVFTSSFREVLEKAFALEDELKGEDALVLDGIAYWCCGNDFGTDDGLKGISLLSATNNNAVVKVEYKNCGEVREHYMKLACIDGQWYCNDWDNKKEDLQRSIEHVIKNTRTEHIHMTGFTMSNEYDKEEPCELDFDETIRFDKVYMVSNAIFKANSERWNIVTEMEGNASDDGLHQREFSFHRKNAGETIKIQIHEFRHNGDAYDGIITIGNKELDIRLYIEE